MSEWSERAQKKLLLFVHFRLVCLEIFILFQRVPWLKKGLRTGSRDEIQPCSTSRASREGISFILCTETLVIEIAHSAVAIWALVVAAGLYQTISLVTLVSSDSTRLESWEMNFSLQLSWLGYNARSGAHTHTHSLMGADGAHLWKIQRRQIDNHSLLSRAGVG